MQRASRVDDGSCSELCRIEMLALWRAHVPVSTVSSASQNTENSKMESNCV